MAINNISGTGRIALGALAAIIIVILVIVLYPRVPQVLPESATVQQAVATTEPVAPTPVEPPEVASVPDVTSPTPETPAAASTPQVDPPGATLPIPPQFDTFRVESDGMMVVAGRAAPGQLVDIIVSGEVIASVIADASGTFAAFPMLAPSDSPRKLSLMADPSGDAVGSDTTYIIAPIAAPVAVADVPDTPQIVETPTVDPGTDVAMADSSAQDEPLPREQVAAFAPPAAPSVLEADADGIRVVQSGSGATIPQVMLDIVLDAIAYEPDGSVSLSGRAIGEGTVQVYLNNDPVTMSAVADDGYWRAELGGVPAGIYTLRVDEMNLDGTVISRIETPFKREEASALAAVMAEETAEPDFEVALKTVQPGTTLWAIAEENFGDGFYYIAVFEANRDLIRDPNLIFPGQVLRIPEPPE